MKIWVIVIFLVFVILIQKMHKPEMWSWNDIVAPLDDRENNRAKVCGRPPNQWWGSNASKAIPACDGNWNNADNVDRACKRDAGQNTGVARGGYAWGRGDGHCSWGFCQINEPKEEHKYACCTAPVNSMDTSYCSVDWCEGQATCDRWLQNTHCKQGLNMLTDKACYKFQDKEKRFMSELCSKPEHFRSEGCKKFCNAEVGSSSEYSAACRTSASEFCKKKENFSDPECACINYDKSDDYTSHIKKFATMANVPSQCWSAPCSKATTWSEVMGSIDQTATGSGRCPSSLQICNQTMTLSEIQAQSLGAISQTCDLNSLKTVTGVTVPPGSPGSSPTSAPTVSLGPTPTPTSRSFFSFSGSSGSGSGSSRTLIGGGISLCFSLIMCAIALLILLM